jgi:peptidylprolyl isomerase
VPTNKQRREPARRHLERQLQRRVEREQRRRRVTLIASIAGTLVLIVVIVVAFTAFSGDDSKPKKTASGGSRTGSTTAAPTTSAAASACPTGTKPVPVAKGAGKTVSFDGVTVKGGTDMSKPPSVGSHATKAPTKLAVKDLVVGKGKTATPTSTVSVKYDGVLYCDGTEFDGPDTHGDKAVSFPLTGVVPGFTQGIGGDKSTGIAPMKVGGRRIIVVPAAMGYGAQANGAIPANAPLVFIVDLESVK